ncbi:tail length tape measure protein [Bacillus phage 000TH010]|uniref:Tape measure protein n=1 Tax=Bacillus phage 000TH010 TaxID=2601652 RepID=A0A5P8PHM8_9CAUD|nr:tail length tape measure protein [Bacillus phage 000TH010]QFR56238.1 tape measure protein [Bacillus phage 000TH010]
MDSARLQAVVTANIREFQRKMATVNRIARSTVNHVTVTVDARTEKFENAMNRLARITGSLSTVIGGALRGALMSAFPAAVPAAASLVGVVGSLGPMLGVAAGGAAGLGSAFATAGAGAVAFGALATSNLKGVFEASSELEKLQKKLDSATSAKERQKILEQIEQVTKNLNKEERNALKTLNSFKSTWDGIAKSVQKPILRTFTTSLDTFKGVLKSLTPMFRGVAAGGESLAKSMQKAFKAPDMKNFINYLNTEAPSAFVSFGKISGNVVRTLMNLMVAFGPLGKSMTSSIEGATAAWVKWSAGLSSSVKFQKFIAYVQTNGPKLLKIISNLSSGIVSLFSGFAPLSADMMTSLVNLTAKFKQWAAGVKDTKGFQNFIDYIRTNGPIVWKTLGDIATTLINLGVAMAPVGAEVLKLINSFASWTAATTKAHPEIGKFMAVAISLGGALRALTPVIVSFQTLFGGFSSISKAVGLIRKFKESAAGIKLAAAIADMKLFTTTSIAMNAQIAKTKFTNMITQLGLFGTKMRLQISIMAAYVKQLIVTAAQQAAFSAKMAASYAAAKVTAFVTMLKNGIVQMGLWIKNMAIMAAQSTANAVKMAAAWTAARISAFASMLAAGIKQMIAFGVRLAALAAAAAANAARMAASWVIAMGPVGWITAAVVALVALIIANWDKIKAVTLKVWGAVSKWLSDTWNKIKQAASVVWQALVTLVKKNFELQKKVITTVYNSVKSFISKIWNGIKSTVTNIWNGLKNAASTAFLYMKNKITNHIVATREKLVSLWNSAKSKATSIWNGLKSAASTSFLYIKNKVTAHITATRDKMVSLWNSAKSKVMSIWNGIKSAASNAFLYMKNQIANRIIATKERIVSIWNSVMSFFRGINLASIGRNIMQGLINGVTGMWGRVTSTFSRLTNAIPGTIKKILGIHSPSRLMRDEIGYHIGTGLVKGITGTESMVGKAAASLARSAVPEVPSLAINGSYGTGALEQSVSASLENFDLPEKNIIIQMDKREVGRAVEEPVREFTGRKRKRR